METIKKLVLPIGVIDNNNLISLKYPNLKSLSIFINEEDEEPDTLS